MEEAARQTRCQRQGVFGVQCLGTRKEQKECEEGGGGLQRSRGRKEPEKDAPRPAPLGSWFQSPTWSFVSLVSPYKKHPQSKQKEELAPLDGSRARGLVQDSLGLEERRAGDPDGKPPTHRRAESPREPTRPGRMGASHMCLPSVVSFTWSMSLSGVRTSPHMPSRAFTLSGNAAISEEASKLP